MSFISRNRVAMQARPGSFLTLDDIAKVAPSALAQQPHDSRSERYAYIPTTRIIEGMERNGFGIVKAAQGRSRIAGKAEFTKHMLRFRHLDARANVLNGTFPEVVLVNSHDGTSAYKLMSGVFRLVCLNGMVVCDKEGESLTVQHKGDVVRQVIEGSYEVVQDAQRAIEGASAWAGINLDRAEKQVMAEAAHVLRFGDAEGNVDTAIPAHTMLAPRRREDVGDSLWTTFNVIQENAIKGGMTGRAAPNRERGEWRGRRTTAREVTGIDQDVKLNKALWTLAAKMAELKGAA